MEAKDDSPARGLKSILTKKKRGSRDEAVSVFDRNSPLRQSTESVLSKFGARSDSLDDDNPGDSKISKFKSALGKRREKRRRKSRPQTEESTEDLGGGNGIPKSSDSLGLSRSASTLNDEHNSLLTSESEDDIRSSNTAAPPLISHESHAGYLTSTSPEIKATAIPPSPGLSLMTTPSPRTMLPLNKSTTMPAVRTSITSEPFKVEHENKNNEGSQTFPPSLDTGLLRETSRSRSISPSSKAKDPAPKITGSLASRRLSKSSDSAVPAAIEALGATSIKANQSVPSIVIPDSPTDADIPKDTPQTKITPPTPVGDGESLVSESVRPRSAVPPTNARLSNLSTPTMGGPLHRRARSDSNTPSKLSHTMSAPLTPTLEEVRTPGSRNVSGATASSNGGFFSSVFSVAQNAASTLSSTLGNTTTRPRSSASQKLVQDGQGLGETAMSADSQTFPEGSTQDASKPLAIDTIGSGDLSLSHLGISADAQSTNDADTQLENDTSEPGTGRARSETVIHREDAAIRNENLPAPRSASSAFGNKSEEFPASTPVAEDVTAATKPVMPYEPSLNDDKISLSGSLPEVESNTLFRSGSLRSSVRRKGRRQRNSSGTGTSTIGAAIAASHSALSTPANASTPKITGFAVANKKRNKDFHQLFRSVPEDDYLIEDYSCALQRDIILAGRIYISEGHICFSSNILGWVTTLVISFDEVVSVEKESTAMLFANAIAVQTLHARHTFRSLLSRDATYDLVIGIWKINHPGLQSSENGVRLANGTGSKTEKVDLDDVADGSDGSILSGEIYDEDDEDEDSDEEETASFLGSREGSILGSEPGDLAPKTAALRKSSTMLGVAAGQAAGSGPPVGDLKNAERALSVAASGIDFPGPTSHAPTECSDTATHYDKLLKDEVIPAPLGKVYSLVFGGASGGFMSRWLVDEIKVTGLQMQDDKKGLTEEKKSRSYSYIKPLNAPIGPRTTKCIITEELETFDLEKAITVTVTTQTPDVPSGNLFSTKTRYCFMWGPNNGTRLVMCFALEWTGKSWIKGAIEKGANDGQITYANDLVKALRTGLVSRSRTFTSTSKGKKVRKRKSDGDALKSSHADGLLRSKTRGWRILEPVFGILSPAIEVCRPLFSLQSLVFLLVFLLVISWFGNSRYRQAGPTLKSQPQGYPYLRPDTAGRIAAYEEIWRNEEAGLWDWLEERVGLTGDNAFPDQVGRKQAGSEGRQEADGSWSRGPMVDHSSSMSDRELDWAIKLTEEKLRLLKRKVENGKRNRAKDTSSAKNEK